MGTRQNVLSFVDDIAIYIFYYQTWSTPMWCLISQRQAVKCQLDAFKNIPLCLSRKVFLWPPRLRSTMVTVFSETCIWFKVFFPFICSINLHCHFACQYKRGNCCQMTSGWYLTLSCLSLVCSATFLTFHFPLSLVLYSSCTWHLSWALSVMSIIIINKVPPICRNHAKRCSSHVKQFAASLMNWLGFTFVLHLT